jgi:small subunit ribosomal protein S1
MPTKLSDLAPGDALAGRVASTELAGAFIDVGAEVSGFVHISNIKPQKINRVEDVLQAGQEVEVWVRNVDQTAERLELTMLRPIELSWSKIKPGIKVIGKVARIENFGAFVDIGAERHGLVHVSEMSLEYVRDPHEIVTVGTEIEALVLDVDRKKRRIRLSMKAAQIEPELEDEEEEEEEELPTAMEVALRQAMEGKPVEAQDVESEPDSRERSKQDELLSRTLSERVQTSSSEGPDTAD